MIKRCIDIKNDFNRIVVKIGTSSITYENGNINIRVLDKLCRTLSDLVHSGKEVILVSSGAVGVGRGKMHIDTKPIETSERQALAAIGQSELMFIYDRLFSEYNMTIAQILLTGDILNDSYRENNAVNTFDTLLKMKVIPIVNENDTVVTEELEGKNFGDNDKLSSIVAQITDSDLLIILTDTDGLYDKDPSKHSDAKRFECINAITPEIKKMATGSNSNRGTGGMISKLNAIESTNSKGIDCCIMSGKFPEKMYDVLEHKFAGTYFRANKI